MNRPRARIRDFFTDHPGYITKAEGSQHSGKAKVCCSRCLDERVGLLMQQDQAEIRSYQRQEARSRDTIVLALFSTPKQSNRSGGEKELWFVAAHSTLAFHVAHCDKWSPAERAEAQAIHDSKKKSPQKMTAHSSRGPSIPFNLPPPISTHRTSSSSAMGDPFAISLNSPPAQDDPSFSTSVPSSPWMASQRGSLYSSDSDIGPADSVSSASFPQRSSSRKRQRVMEIGHPYHTTPAWNTGRQKLFEDFIICITASANFALSWVENLTVLRFFDEFIPAATVPTRKVLTSRILPQTVKSKRATKQHATKGYRGTAVCDGWSGINHHHLVAFMVVVNMLLHTVRIFDTSDERKTAERLYEMMKLVIIQLTLLWGVDVIAFTSDASGESRKARKMLVRDNPWMVAPDCYAHQINLIVGDYFKYTDKASQRYTKWATALITWLRSKTYVLALIRKIQKDGGKTSLTVIRAVLTRWTAHYLAFKRLLELRSVLSKLVADDNLRPLKDSQLITGDAGAKKKARAMIEVINNSVFWHAIGRIKNDLEPLAIASNITQSAFCRLDEVLLTFGYLYVYYSQNLTNSGDQAGKKAILESLETRWSKCEQEVMIAAVILNPFTKTTVFSKSQPAAAISVPANLHDLLCRLYERFFRETAPAATLLSNMRDFLANKGICATMERWAASVAAMAEGTNKKVDPREVYDGLWNKFDTDPIPLFRLADHIYAICANSASCERLFSVLGITLTKLRNRLATQTLADLAELKMFIRDEDLARLNETESGKADGRKDRLKRHFGRAKEPGYTSQPITIPTIAPEHDTDGDITLDDAVPLDDEDVDQVIERGETTSSAFNKIIGDLEKYVDADVDEGSERDRQEFSISLKDLFDSGSLSWMKAYMKDALRSLEEEQEFYELVDLDGEADEDDSFDMEIDANVEAIIHA